MSAFGFEPNIDLPASTIPGDDVVLQYPGGFIVQRTPEARYDEVPDSIDRRHCMTLREWAQAGKGFVKGEVSPQIRKPVDLEKYRLLFQGIPISFSDEFSYDR